MSNSFGERLKELRIARNMSQEELGKKVDTTRQTISNYEIGKRKADYEMLEALADTFNVDIDYLLGKTNKTTVLPQSFQNKQFTTAEEAVQFLFEQKIIAANTGINIDDMSDEDKVQFANRLLDYARWLDDDRKNRNK